MTSLDAGDDMAPSGRLPTRLPPVAVAVRLTPSTAAISDHVFDLNNHICGTVNHYAVTLLLLKFFCLLLLLLLLHGGKNMNDLQSRITRSNKIFFLLSLSVNVLLIHCSFFEEGSFINSFHCYDSNVLRFL